MTDDLIARLLRWKHEVPTTRERADMVEQMREAAAALQQQAQEIARLRRGEFICRGCAKAIRELPLVGERPLQSQEKA